MIQVNNISKEYSGRILFSDVNFVTNKAEKIGLVGRNGSGKSTLFKILTQEILPDDGSVSVPKNYEIGILKQHLEFSFSNIVDECMSVLPSELRYETYRAEKLLTGLGFSKDDFEKSPLSFSGGYQIRLNLAKVLLVEPNMLLLDEPTNYLDIVSMRWLANFLKRYPGELILITHDRDFMKTVCNSTMGIHRQKLIKVTGNYSKYKNKIAEDEALYESTRLNQEKKIKEAEAFVERFKAKASKATQAQSRQKMLDKMQEFDALENIKNLDFKFNYKEIHAKELGQIEGLSFGYTEDLILFKDLKFYINKGDKIAVIGKNGKGKSTLLNCIAKILDPQGYIKLHEGVSIGHFGQTNISRLNDENTIEEEIREENTDLSITNVKGLCAAMMFSGEDSQKKIKVLSGGEKSRVMLGKILAKESNLLLLDEPTNHLDQESIESLVDQIKSFKGSTILVTHSEYILNNLIDKFIVFHEDKCEVFIGSYKDFLEKIGWGDEESQVEKKNKLSNKEINVLRQSIVNERSKILKPIRNKISKLEELIVSSEEKLEVINSTLLEASNESNGDLIQSSSIDLKRTEQVIEDSFLELEEYSEKESSILLEYESKLDDLLN